jgi:hypothetical protein
MRGARTGAGALAALAVGAYGVLVVGGSSLGWTVEIRDAAGGAPELFDALGELPWLSTLLVATLVGSVLAAKRPRHPIPWLLTFGAVGNLLFYPTVVIVAWGLAADPAPTWVPYVAWVSNWVWIVGQAGLSYLLLLFPDGRPLSGRWRPWLKAGAMWVAATLVLAALWPELWPERDVELGLANPFGVDALARVEPLLHGLVAGFMLLQVLAVVSLVLRFRRSTGIERQQMKWMALGVACVAATWPAETLGAPRWIQAIPTFVVIAAIVIAVTRYRLYEIDRVISRTVSYALLSAALVGVYAASVVGLGAVVRAVPGGDGSDLVIATSTLVVAALFGPLRRRVQVLVDQRFNRARVDAQDTLARFLHQIRDDVDLDALRRRTEHVVDQALQPRSVSLWIRVREVAP